jgi:hypothetical protein
VPLNVDSSDNPKPVSFNDAISEAAKQGLIDSHSKSLSEQKYAVRFTRKRGKNIGNTLKAVVNLK